MRLAKPLTHLRAQYDVIVVGSGYGAAVTASRLARAGRQVCVLERGAEHDPNGFPTDLAGAASKLHVEYPDAEGRDAIGSEARALFDVRVNEDISVVVGCGLGGTSLINAAVAMKPHPAVFDDERWPSALRADVHGLAQGYERAMTMLGAEPYPDDLPKIPKLRALEAAAEGNGWPCTQPPVAVNFRARRNAAGVWQEACTLCGDCVAGCRVNAKNSTVFNYLADAVRHGAEIFTGARVHHVAKTDKGWQVFFEALDAGQDEFDGPLPFTAAEIVVLGAGTLGSTEILLRSRKYGLALSSRLGSGFTGNGDALGFAYNCDREVNGIGFGARDELPPVGPCITSVIDLREGDLEQGMVIEEGALPGAQAGMLPGLFAAAAAVIGDDMDHGVMDRLRERGREMHSLFSGSHHGAVNNMLTFLVMAHDEAAGQMTLDGDRLAVHWPGVGEQPVFERIDKALRAATGALGGTFIENPLWNELLGRDAVTVHPLGGCAMGEDASRGVVDHAGRVFTGQGSAVQHGLYVSDGAILPRSLGVNPLLTISALAERNAALMAAEHGWTIDYRPKGDWDPPNTTPRVGIAFTERMSGFSAVEPHADFVGASARGEAAGQTFEFIFTIQADNLDLLLAGASAGLFGTVRAPMLCDEALMATRGEFRLLVDDPARVGEKRMEYRATLTAPDGRHFLFEGFKRVHDDPGLDAWDDTTTLYITVTPQRGVPVCGVLHIEAADFAHQLRTLQAPGARDAGERLEAVGRFGSFFAGELFEVYGGAVAPTRRFNPHAPERSHRRLRLPAPQVHAVRTGDGVPLRLTRYRGGAKGPVLLSHGLGVASSIFSLDTIDTNLTEYLCAAGYDVWLLDHRGSVLLPSSAGEFDADAVAVQDYPAAVAKVLAVSGTHKVDVIAHCFGAATFTMSMLAGLSGVRSAVLSQVSAHMNAPAMTRIKAGLHVPEVLDALGIDHLDAYTDADAGAFERLFDRMLTLQPLELEERCRSAVCHRVTFLYGLLYEHDQLSTATHDTLHELFGRVNMKAMAQLASMVQHGHLLNAAGEDVYLPKAKRLALPITFIHGEENQCYLPESTARTVEWLSANNDASLYRRHVIAGYGHIDCIFGKNAARDVYPYILEHLEAQK